ncbi:MAG: hypothetical protein FVQ85_06715 [Planctomycetes bacterium]|nr:hypothetical protein [Planctomycetota bacterium]
MKSRVIFIVGVLTVLMFAMASRAEIKIVADHNRNQYATSNFKFKNVPSPSKSDAAAKAVFTIVDGRRDRNGGNVDKLHDGKIPTEEDQPSENFFFNAGTNGGRLLVDLGGTIDIKQVNTYSWHTSTRGPQVYKLYAGDGRADDFNPKPKTGTDPETCGWKLVASVNTRPKERPGGQYGVSICDSNGTIGRYHYLLFDISRTEGTDPFGNTFYSEIDVVEPNAPVVVVTQAAKTYGETFEAEGGKYQITIYTSETPDLTEWAHKELAPVLQQWYPKIVKMLPSPGYQAPGRVSITFSPNMQGVAAASGTRIRCGARWFRRQLQGEAKGAVVHELVHVVQQYGRARRTNRNATRNPGWLVEGIADYIRWFLYEPQTRGAEVTGRNIARARYDGSYRITGNFLNWVTETYDKNIVRKLNAAAREGRYNQELWKEATGRTLQELGDQWKRSLEKKIAAETPAAVKTSIPTDQEKEADKSDDKTVENTDVSEKSDAELAEEMASNTVKALEKGPLSYPKGNGLRIVSTGHSWVAPALWTLPAIAKAAGLDGHHQRKHISGGGSGTANAIWLAEIGKSDGNSEPNPILIPAIATGRWDVMTWGIFHNDKPENFEQWIDFCLKYNPKMVFYLQDAWTGTVFYRSEKELSLDKFDAGQKMVNIRVKNIMEPLRKKYPGKVHVIPVGNSMLELLKLYYAGELPGIEGISKHLCKKEYTLWSDGGHLGKHMHWWEGYVYYAAIYKKSPELIEAGFEVTEYNAELDKLMRKCAWKAVVNHPYSGITDRNENGIADQIENTPGK